MQKTYLFAALMAALATGAHAQSAPPPQKDTTDTSTLEGMTVTAEHREENVQKIPLAVSVVDTKAWESTGSSDVSQLATLVPSVTFSAGNELRNNSIRIRGIGTDVFSTGVEPSVSTVIDGVVLQRPGAAFTDFSDIERIEVLRGPQGTLFGMNASAGVVNVVTRGPNFDGTDGSVNVLVAQDNERRLSADYSAPIDRNLAYHVAAFGRTQDGNVDNLHTGGSVNDQDAYGFRGKLGWRSDDQRSDVTFGADFSRLNADCCALPLIIATKNPKALVTGTNVGRDNDNVNNDLSPFVRQKNYGGSLTANVALGDYTLTSITAWRKFDNTSNEDLDDTQAQFIANNYNIETSRTTTQELRIASPTGGAVDYVAGLFYIDGSVYNYLYRNGLNIGAVSQVNPDGSIVPLVPGQGVLTGNSVVDTQNASAFGQANWHLTDRFTLTGGLRYIDEHQTLHFVRPIGGYFNGANAPATNPAFGPVTGHYDDTAVIGKVAATYNFTPAVTGYVSYSTGYKGEGLAATLGLTAAQFAQLPAPAEKSRLIEAGLKTALFDNRLLFNLTGFLTRFNHYQAQTYNAAAGLFLLTSAGRVDIDGVELEATARPTANLTFSGGITYLDATFANAPNGPCYTGQTVAQGCAPNVPGGSPVQNLNGKPFMNAPKWRSTWTARYERPIGDGLRGYVQGNYRWQDHVIYDISQDPRMTQGAYGVADFYTGVVFGGGAYDLGLFVKNVFDRQYAANIMAVSSAGGSGAYAQQIARDFRRYGGISFRATF
jgi:iron complex outermembrane receptor protein